MSSPQPDRLLTRQTGVTIGLGVMILGAAVSAAWWFGRWTGADRAWKESMDRRLELIEHSLDEVALKGTVNRWTSVDMRRWAERLKEQNSASGLKVPVPFTADD